MKWKEYYSLKIYKSNEEIGYYPIDKSVSARNQQSRDMLIFSDRGLGCH